MKETKVGKIKNIKYDDKNDQLELTILVTDDSFKKKILRDLSLSGKLKVVDDELLFQQDEDATV